MKRCSPSPQGAFVGCRVFPGAVDLGLDRIRLVVLARLHTVREFRMKLAAGYAPEPAQQVGLHPDLFCSANDLPALGVSDFESPFAYGTDDGFFTPNEKYLIHRCRMFHNVILLSLILGTTLRNINLAGESSYCGVFYFTSIPVSRIYPHWYFSGLSAAKQEIKSTCSRTMSRSCLQTGRLSRNTLYKNVSIDTMLAFLFCTR